LFRASKRRLPQLRIINFSYSVAFDTEIDYYVDGRTQGAKFMSTQEQARALMMRHHRMIKNREQCMLSRAVEAAGMPAEVGHFWNHIQGKPHSDAVSNYDRSGVGLS
jgi:hypothetical protein